MATERLTELNGRKVAFPDVNGFAGLFPVVGPAEGNAAVLAESVGWGGKRERTYLTGFLIVSGQLPYRSLHVRPAPVVLDYFRDHVLHCDRDRMYFEVVGWDDGRALVVLQHNAIIGNHYLAVIDAATIPEACQP